MSSTSTAQILTALPPVTGLDATAVALDPPTQATMVALGFTNRFGPLAVEVVIAGENATARALTGAYWFGWHSKLDKAVLLAPVNKGYDLSLSTSKFFAEVLELVAGLYSHIGIGKGTLAASTIALHVHPIEIHEG